MSTSAPGHLVVGKTARIPSMTSPRLLVLALSLAAFACGPSASISGLRCQETCQSLEDPFLLLLEADLDDPDGEMSGGVLLIRINDAPSSALELDPLMKSTGGQVHVLRFGVALPFDSVADGQKFTVHVRASHDGRQTGNTTLPFTIHL